VIFKSSLIRSHRDLPVHVCIGDCISGDSLVGVIPDCSLRLSHDSLPPILVGVGDCLGREDSTSHVLHRRCVSGVSCLSHNSSQEILLRLSIYSGATFEGHKMKSQDVTMPGTLWRDCMVIWRKLLPSKLCSLELERPVRNDSPVCSLRRL